MAYNVYSFPDVKVVLNHADVGRCKGFVLSHVIIGIKMNQYTKESYLADMTFFQVFPNVIRYTSCS